MKSRAGTGSVVPAMLKNKNVDMFNDSAGAVERVRRGGTHSSSNTAKLVNMDVWYATTLWLALLSGWIDPSSGRRTRKNPTGGILMKPIMPPALLTPQAMDDPYYYDQGGPPMPPHPAMPANFPMAAGPGPAFDPNLPQQSRLWRSIDDPVRQQRPAKNNQQFSPASFGGPHSQIRNANMAAQRFQQNFQNPFQQPPPMRAMGGPPNKGAVLPRMPEPRDDRRDSSISEEGPSFNKGNNPYQENRNPFNRGNPFAKGPQFNNGPPPPQFNQDNPEAPLNERDSMSADGGAFGQSLEWSGRQRRQPPRLPSLPPSMENAWEPISRYGSMRRQSPSLLRNMERFEDKQGGQGDSLSPLDISNSQSEELVGMMPMHRNGQLAAQARSMMARPQQAINFPYAGPPPMMNPRLQQRPLVSMVQRQYGPESQDYMGDRRMQRMGNSPLKMRNGGNMQQYSRMHNNLVQVPMEENPGNGGLVKMPTDDKQIESKKLVQQSDDEFIVDSKEHQVANVTTGKPSQEQPKKESKSSEVTSDESKAVEESGSSEESTTKKSSHKSKSSSSQHEHKHKEQAVAVATETDEVVSKHGHGHSHHSNSKAKSKVNESSGSDEGQHGQPKKRRPITTLATDFAVDVNKKENVGNSVAVEAKQS